MRRKTLITIVLVICLTACADSSDPRVGGFLGGIGGICGGSYDKRVGEREDRVAKEQKINRDLLATSRVLENEAQLRDRTLALERQRVSKLEEDLSHLEVSTNKLRAKSDQQGKELANLKLKIDQLKKRLNSQNAAIKELDHQGGSEANSEQFRILRQERDRLSEEYGRLLKYFQALSEANS